MEAVVVMRWYVGGVIFFVSGFSFWVIGFCCIPVIFGCRLLHSDFGDTRDVAHELASMIDYMVLLW